MEKICVEAETIGELSAPTSLVVNGGCSLCTCNGNNLSLLIKSNNVNI